MHSGAYNAKNIDLSIRITVFAWFLWVSGPQERTIWMPKGFKMAFKIDQNMFWNSALISYGALGRSSTAFLRKKEPLRRQSGSFRGRKVEVLGAKMERLGAKTC